MYPEPFMMFAVLVLGCAAFFFGVFYVFFRVIAGLGRGLARMVAPGRPAGTDPVGARHGPGYRVCPRAQCRRVEYRPARFCSQCGCPMAGESGMMEGTV